MEDDDRGQHPEDKGLKARLTPLDRDLSPYFRRSNSELIFLSPCFQRNNSQTKSFPQVHDTTYDLSFFPHTVELCRKNI